MSQELKRLKAIERAARSLMKAIERNLDSEPTELKYCVPFGPATELLIALEARLSPGEQL